MSRPFYETETDRRQEKNVIESFISLKAPELEFKKLKPSCIIDYAITKNKQVVAVAEVKNRNYSREDMVRFGGVIISTSKVFAAKNWIDLGVVFVLIVKLTDGLFYLRINENSFWPKLKVTIAGRADRGDWQDFEPCCLFTMDLFEEIKSL